MVTATKQHVDTRRFVSSTSLTNFTDQYYHAYNIRLKKARPALLERAQSRWTDIQNVPIEGLNASLGDNEVFVIGTLFKSMPKQPSILRELEENEPTPDPNANFTSDDDVLILHETDENVQLVGDIKPHEHVTGIPVAVKGIQLNGGAKFRVEDICYSGLELDVYRPSSTDETANGESVDKSGKMVIISGLEFGVEKTFSKDQQDQYVAALKGFLELLNGDKSIKRIVIAGNSAIQGVSKNRSEVFANFDKYLHNIAQSSDYVDVMPGRTDPTSFLIPQQPFHPKILPKSGLLENVTPNTNPCLIQFEDLIIVGTSGEIVDTIRQHSRLQESTTILKHTLEWGHIAPCAPDNLSCIPFKDSDPFLIDFVPDIYFVGNQMHFCESSWLNGSKRIRLISVPRFCKSLSCVQINLSNLHVEQINLAPKISSQTSN